MWGWTLFCQFDPDSETWFFAVSFRDDLHATARHIWSATDLWEGRSVPIRLQKAVAKLLGDALEVGALHPDDVSEGLR